MTPAFASYSEFDVAFLTGLPLQSLRQARCKTASRWAGNVPPHRKARGNGRISYTLADLLAWARANDKTLDFGRIPVRATVPL